MGVVGGAGDGDKSFLQSMRTALHGSTHRSCGLSLSPVQYLESHLQLNASLIFTLWGLTSGVLDSGTPGVKLQGRMCAGVPCLCL